MNEEWRPVPSEPGYWASSEGRIRGKRGKVLRPGKERRGHQYVIVSRGSRFNVGARKVHHLVLEAFVGPRPIGANSCRHFDDDPSNNNINNLAWGTKSENTEDAYQNGRLHTRLDADAVRQIRRMAAGGMTNLQIGKFLQLQTQHVKRIVERRLWKRID